jgi:hypothetical protein
MMRITPESLYQQAGTLVQSMPELAMDGELSQDKLQWLGKLAALLQEAGEFADLADLKTTMHPYIIGANRSYHSSRIYAIMFRLLAISELRAPTASQGAFIPAGNQFDGLAAVGKILQGSTVDVLIVDPYMDEKALTTFAVLAAENVTIRLLADAAHAKPAFKPAVTTWAEQYGVKRPVEARLASARTLHDRLLITDNQDAFTLGQSLNAFAVRAPTSILKADHETAGLKVAAYTTIWRSADPL